MLGTIDSQIARRNVLGDSPGTTFTAVPPGGSAERQGIGLVSGTLLIIRARKHDETTEFIQSRTLHKIQKSHSNLQMIKREYILRFLTTVLM